jgi:hypothetical protein
MLRLEIEMPAVRSFHGKDDAPDLKSKPWINWGWCSLDEIHEGILMRHYEDGIKWSEKDLLSRFKVSPAPRNHKRHKGNKSLEILTSRVDCFNRWVYEVREVKHFFRHQGQSAYVPAAWAKAVLSVLLIGGREVIFSTLAQRHQVFDDRGQLVKDYW